jgi:hypothetical protein
MTIWYPDRCPYPDHAAAFCERCHTEEPGPAPCEATIEDIEEAC